jgi:hypothetical protein
MHNTRRLSHFIERVRERIGPHEDAVALNARLVDAVRREDRDVATFVARLSRSGKRLFRFTAQDGRTFFAVIDTVDMVCVTVMPPGFDAKREKRPSIRLKEPQR